MPNTPGPHCFLVFPHPKPHLHLRSPPNYLLNAKPEAFSVFYQTSPAQLLTTARVFDPGLASSVHNDPVPLPLQLQGGVGVPSTGECPAPCPGAILGEERVPGASTASNNSLLCSCTLPETELIRV